MFDVVLGQPGELGRLLHKPSLAVRSEEYILLRICD
jgi:hypothetical protein